MGRIEDGLGSGRQAKVDSQRRLSVQAVSEAESVHSTEAGTSYNLNTGLISITADATLMYYKNTGEKDFVIEAIALGSFEGITHSDDPYITIVRNPTGGDLITDATTAGVLNQNRNFGASDTLSGLFYKGKVGGTLTGGDDIAILQATPGARSFYTINFILTKGDSIGVKLNANVSSGSANWYSAIIGFEKINTKDPED
jgi:hypothetical protein